MKKRLFLALVLGFAGLAFRVISPEVHFLTGFRIALAPRDPDHPKHFAFAAYNLKAIPEGYWVHEIAPAYVLALEGQRDLPEDFERFTPEQHYLAAIYPCRHDPENPGPIYTDCLLDSPQDIAHALRHLATIPPSSKVYDDAARAIGLLKIQRDKPEDFEAARLVDYRQCEKTAWKKIGGATSCAHVLDQVCDLFSLTQANNLVIASYKPPPSKYRYTEEEVLKRVKAAAAQEVRP